MYHRKAAIMLCIGSILLSLTSCIFGGNTIFSDDGLKAQARMEQIIDAINRKDDEEIKGMFSETALSESEDFDERLDYLFHFVKGDIISWEEGVAGQTSENINRGKREKISNSYYYFYTEDKKYLIFMKEHTIDTERPENVGVYLIQVIQIEEDTHFTWAMKVFDAGIYLGEKKETARYRMPYGVWHSSDPNLTIDINPSEDQYYGKYIKDKEEIDICITFYDNQKAFEIKSTYSNREIYFKGNFRMKNDGKLYYEMFLSSQDETGYKTIVFEKIEEYEISEDQR